MNGYGKNHHLIEQVIQYIPSFKPTSHYFKEKLPKDIKDLLHYILNFYPDERATATELLKLKIFDKVRQKKTEAGAPCTVIFPFDDCSSKNEKLTVEDYIYKLTEEIRLIRHVSPFKESFS
jgi:serine/threonine protein kinase